MEMLDFLTGRTPIRCPVGPRMYPAGYMHRAECTRPWRCKVHPCTPTLYYAHFYVGIYSTWWYAHFSWHIKIKLWAYAHFCGHMCLDFRMYRQGLYIFDVIPEGGLIYLLSYFGRYSQMWFGFSLGYIYPSYLKKCNVEQNSSWNLDFGVVGIYIEDSSSCGSRIFCQHGPPSQNIQL